MNKEIQNSKKTKKEHTGSRVGKIVTHLHACKKREGGRVQHRREGRSAWMGGEFGGEWIHV